MRAALLAIAVALLIGVMPLSAGAIIYPDEDTTPPEVMSHVDGTQGDNGWWKMDVEVSFSAWDEEGGSGVDRIEYYMDDGTWQAFEWPVSMTDGIHSVSYRAWDRAGNVSPTHTFTIKVDHAAPSLKLETSGTAGLNGWWVSPVTITATATDLYSGVKDISYRTDWWYTYTSPLKFGDGQRRLMFTTSDFAGNTREPRELQLNIDSHGPSADIIVPAYDGTYLLGEPVIADWQVRDYLSGVERSSGTVASGQPIDTSSPGIKHFSVEATDRAGNHRSTTQTYTVAYDYSGTLQPLAQDGTSFFKVGSFIPVKFTLKDYAGTIIDDAVASATVAPVKDGVPGAEVPAYGGNTKSNLFRYDTSKQQYVLSWSTKGMSAGAYLLRIRLDDGTVREVKLTLK